MRILEYVVPEEFSNRPVLHFLKGHLKFDEQAETAAKVFGAYAATQVGSHIKKN